MTPKLTVSGTAGKPEPIPALDGLRALACLLVLFSHAGNLGLFYRIAGAGQLGVMLFFALSGFLMAHLYAGAGAEGGRWSSYFVRRFFRVYPPYIAVVMIGFSVGLVVQPFVYAMTVSEFGAHLVLQGTKSVFWTIPVEMRFYLLFPLLCFFTTGMSDVKAAIFYSVLGAAFIFFEPVGLKYTLWPYVEFFVVGCCAAHMYRLFRHRPLLWDIVLAASLVGIAVSIPVVSQSLFDVEHRLWLDAGFFAPLMALAVLSCALASGFLARLLSSLPLRWVGRISFSLYLVHFPILHLVRSVIPPAYALIPALLLSLLVAWVSYRLLEKPSQAIGITLERRFLNRERTGFEAAPIEARAAGPLR